MKHARRISELAQAAAYDELKNYLDGLDPKRLAASWPELKPIEQLVVFKLMDGPLAMELYGELSFKEKYFMLCGFSLNAISPILEKMEPLKRRLFHQLPRDDYDKMFRQLVSQRVELDVPVSRN